MKVRFSIILCVLTALISCVILSGCENNENNSEKDKEKKEHKEVVAVTIHQTGGDGGVDIEWEVYSQNDLYYLSYSDNSTSRIKPLQYTFEITEQEYKTIMSLDYEEDEDVESFWENLSDRYCFHSTITYKNGDEKTTDMVMENVTCKLKDLLYEKTAGE